jgi:hypothetical protein
MHRTIRASAAVTVAALGLVGGGLRASAASSPSTEVTADRATAVRGVCQGVRDCRVAGRFDVTGDGRRDRVGLVNHDRDGHIRRAAVTVRVKTASGRLIKQRVVVRNWRGAVWFGQAAVNGRPGQEIVLGGDRRKYTSPRPGGDQVSFSRAYHVVTFQPGSDLAIARTPDRSRKWSLTSPDGVRSGSGSALFYHERGWWRTKVNGHVRIQKRWLSTGGAAGVRSNKTVWAWRNGHWRKLSSGSMTDPLSRRYGGWHVKGLRVW